ncbi:MAG: AAA family ATPase, partial [Gammaproteobacteria bacterium]|nr:AAA family ATPase [Gammaproteobacteria bacterium]
FAKNTPRQAIQLALKAEICFAMLVKEMTEHFPEIVYDNKGAISFGEIAFLATKNPEIFNPNTFNASEYIIDPKINKIIKFPTNHDTFFTKEFISSFLQHYTPEEKNEIAKDLKNIREYTFDKAVSLSQSDAPLEYVATAGAPGAGKTTVIETFIKENHLKNYVYADPDQILKNMNYTYRKSLSNYHFAEAKSNHDALKDAYNKWRPASNYICHEMLQIAFGSENKKETQFCLAHGTTSTNLAVEQLYKKIKSRNYSIHLLLCYSPDPIRKEAIEKREKEQAFVQVDAKEVISKGEDFLKRFDVYFSYADKISFYWNDKLEHGRLPVSCATFNKLSDNSTVLMVTDPVGWEFFCKKYLADCEQYQINMCDDFKSLIPKKILKKSEKVSPHVTHGLYGALSKSKSSSIEKLEMRETEKICRAFS